MPYNGIEIDMLALGDADSLLVTRWENNVPTHILIDGGRGHDTDKVRRFLASREIDHIHELVNSHFHDDHAEGLIGLVQDTTLTFDRAWVHRPERHVDMDAVKRALGMTAMLKESRLVTASINTERELISALNSRDIEIVEPFEGRDVDFLRVCGPSEAFYTELVQNFKDVDKLRRLEEERNDREQDAGLQETFGQVLGKTAAAKARPLLKNPRTDPENDSSTILATIIDGKKFLFTADAGAKALSRAADYVDLTSPHWMQMSHHGSIYNITQSLISHFSPKTVYVSADGNAHRPHATVVEAYKATGASVFSTHHPTNGHLRFHFGEVPARHGYTSATSL